MICALGTWFSYKIFEMNDRLLCPSPEPSEILLSSNTPVPKVTQVSASASALDNLKQKQATTQKVTR